MTHSFDLTNRVAVVIGATSGLGRTLAVGLAQHGADVVPTGRRRQLLEALCGEIEAEGRATLCQTADVTDRASIDALRDAVLERFGRIDILVNAAAHTMKQPSVEIPEDRWACLLDTNLSGALRACQSLYGALKESGQGRVINIASLGSFLAFHQVAAYCAAKAGLVSLTKSLACEWARDGITVNAIAPGVFTTDMNREFISGTPRGEELLLRTPMGRFGTPEELVGVAVLLASSAASYLTGQCIVVDGGYLASGVNT
jgi:NAD(P)-dependent dehydrogenase (short-subunit alcohol dehydrogenase family)